MRAIHVHPCALHDAVEQASRRDADAVGDLYGRCLLSVPEDIVHLGREILVERASTGDVHGLHATANGEGRNLCAEGEKDQVEFEAGAPFGDDRKVVSLGFPVEGWVQVRAAARE